MAWHNVEPVEILCNECASPYRPLYDGSRAYECTGCEHWLSLNDITLDPGERLALIPAEAEYHLGYTPAAA